MTNNSKSPLISRIYGTKVGYIRQQNLIPRIHLNTVSLGYLAFYLNRYCSRLGILPCKLLVKGDPRSSQNKYYWHCSWLSTITTWWNSLAKDTAHLAFRTERSQSGILSLLASFHGVEMCSVDCPEKKYQWSYPPLVPACCNTDLSGKRCPLVQQWYDYYG